MDLFTSQVVWHYNDNGTRKGPVSTERLRQLQVLKLVTPASLVWRSGMAKWAPLESLRELEAPPASIGGPGIIRAEGADVPDPGSEPDPAAGTPPPVPADSRRQAGDPEPRPEPSDAEMRKEIKQHRAAAPARRSSMRTTARRMMIMIGPGLSLGIFAPGDVNDWLDGKFGSSTVEGTPGMYINFVPRISAAFSPIEYVQIQAVGEIGWGPKMVQRSGGSSDIYSFTRFSVGTVVTGHLPLKNYRYNLYGGAGFLYHWMSFEDFSGDTPGARAVLGFRIYNRTFTPEIVLTFDYARATTAIENIDPHTGMPSVRDFTLDYTGVTIGANFHFNLFNK